MEKWMQVFEAKLREAIQNHPDEYAYPLSEIEFVLHRMRGAFERGSYNKDSHAIKATCKHLGIKHTYAAIAEFIKQSE